MHLKKNNAYNSKKKPLLGIPLHCKDVEFRTQDLTLTKRML